MVVRKCEGCHKAFESEGHDLGEWLNLCHNCNAKKDRLGGASVLWSESKLKKFYKKLGSKQYKKPLTKPKFERY